MTVSVFGLSPLVLLLMLQGLLMLVDEFAFHRRRGLGWWERWGHPLDSLSVLACFLIAALAPLRLSTVSVYLAASVVSCLLVTKDEWVHRRECSSAEQWLHGVLFILHPVVLMAGLMLWIDRSGILPSQGYIGPAVLLDLWRSVSVGPWTATLVLYSECAAIGLFILYQINHYFVLGRGRRPSKVPVTETTGAVPELPKDGTTAPEGAGPRS